MAVEKLICRMRFQIASRQDALQTIFSGRLGISIPQNHAVLLDIDFFSYLLSRSILTKLSKNCASIIQPLLLSAVS